jgi:hypothetical protein
MMEVVARLETQPSDSEWSLIRKFRLRADELAKSSLVSAGYAVSANEEARVSAPITTQARPSQPLS